jgi:hypothetical protein
MRKIIGANLPLLVIIFTAAAATATTQAAYAQGQPPLPPQQQPSDIKIIDGDDIQNNILTDITLSELQNYRLHEDGRAEYIFESTNPGSNRTITVLTNHGYTSAQGYIYNSTGIYTPDGNQRLVIATE